MRQLINMGSLVKNTANHNRANVGVLFLNLSGKKVRICPFYMRSVKGMFQALFPAGYKRKEEGMIAGYQSPSLRTQPTLRGMAKSPTLKPDFAAKKWQNGKNSFGIFMST